MSDSLGHARPAPLRPTSSNPARPVGGVSSARPVAPVLRQSPYRRDPGETVVPLTPVSLGAASRGLGLPGITPEVGRTNHLAAHELLLLVVAGSNPSRLATHGLTAFAGNRGSTALLARRATPGPQCPATDAHPTPAAHNAASWPRGRGDPQTAARLRPAGGALDWWSAFGESRARVGGRASASRGAQARSRSAAARAGAAGSGAGTGGARC